MNPSRAPFAAPAPILVLLSLLTTFAVSTRAQSPADINRLAPVSVSSANYRDTRYDELSRLVNSKNTVKPTARELTPLAKPVYYVFIRGEIFPSDVTYEQLCLFLTPELAKKNYVNAADDQGRIYHPEQITLMLRVNYGISLWRNPIVRTEHITWDEGLVGKVHDSRSLTHNGGTRGWDSRAGGDDNALGLIASNTADGKTPADSSKLDVGTYESTREFNLVVIDAFDHAELMKKGKSAKTLWTTFIAAPVEHGQKFSQILPAMLRAATPYWGETTTGLQVFNDTRAEVRIGEAVEVKDSPVKK